MRGQKRTQATIKLEGEPKKSQIHRQRVKSNTKLTKPRKILNERESKHWDIIVAHRGAWLQASDQAMLVEMCRTFDLMCKTRQAYEANLADHQMRCSYSALTKQWHTFAKAIGMDPKSRELIGPAHADPVDEDLAARYLA